MIKNAILDPGDQFHIGIVAADFEATVARLTEVLGYEWGPEVGGAVAVDLPGGNVAELDLRCAYSITVPRLEVVRSVAGTLWDPAGEAGVHHIGYWSADVAADAAALAERGYLVEASRPGPQGGLFFAFLRSAEGFRVELVDRAAESSLAQCWAAPPTPGGAA
ncbi:VOC family protein [Nocardia jiangxiensis]|uniref:VOC family protein n=1 Tax=Nocardia jiangxiensis TaxID=282685 RepID=UPI0002E15E03|nr:VOC family protein [Nocardia jiangxiensis]